MYSIKSRETKNKNSIIFRFVPFIVYQFCHWMIFKCFSLFGNVSMQMRCLIDSKWRIVWKQSERRKKKPLNTLQYRSVLLLKESSQSSHVKIELLTWNWVIKSQHNCIFNAFNIRPFSISHFVDFLVPLLVIIIFQFLLRRRSELKRNCVECDRLKSLFFPFSPFRFFSFHFKQFSTFIWTTKSTIKTK